MYQTDFLTRYPSWQPYSAGINKDVVPYLIVKNLYKCQGTIDEFIYFLFILYFMLIFTIKDTRLGNLYNSLGANSYTNGFNKQICMLIIYVNPNNGDKINCLKTILNIQNINITTKYLRKTNRPLTENPIVRKPG